MQLKTQTILPFKWLHLQTQKLGEGKEELLPRQTFNIKFTFDFMPQFLSHSPDQRDLIFPCSLNLRAHPVTSRHPALRQTQVCRICNSNTDRLLQLPKPGIGRNLLGCCKGIQGCRWMQKSWTSMVCPPSWVKACLACTRRKVLLIYMRKKLVALTRNSI